MTPITKREPALSVGSLSALVSAILVLAVALGAPISDEVQTAVLAVIAAAGPIVAGVMIRRRVWSEDAHQADKAKAIEETAAAYGYKEVPDADA